jgi:hypothetical protein
MLLSCVQNARHVRCSGEREPNMLTSRGKDPLCVEFPELFFGACPNLELDAIGVPKVSPT